MTILFWIVAIVLVLAGIAGTILPALPGIPLVFAGLLLAAWIDGFQKVGWMTLALLALLTLLSLLVDLFLSAAGARKMGAGRAAFLGAAIGMIIGIFFGLPGIILGPFIGAFAGEYLVRRDWLQAGKAGIGAWLGILGGIAVKLTLSVVMVVIFSIAYLL